MAPENNKPKHNNTAAVLGPKGLPSAAFGFPFLLRSVIPVAFFPVQR
jgi:hypothetical protein